MLAVVAYHVWPDLLPGGFAGVDVFFVISGFLITRLLLKELHATGRLHLVKFWARRARRILPAASLVLLATAIAAPLAMSPLDLLRTGGDIQAAGVFMQNWRLAANAMDYFQQDTNANAVMHFWSLAVEEQFYLVWPMVLICIAFGGRALAVGLSTAECLFGVVVLIWLLSFGLSCYFTSELPPWAFFGTFTRAWQLASGALLALLVTRSVFISRKVRGATLVLAMTFLVASFVFITPETAYPGWLALVPTVATCCLIGFGSKETETYQAQRLLLQPTLRFLGRVSFSWYLWHWPFLTIGVLAFDDAGFLERGLFALAALIAAIGTFKYVENPIRFHPQLMRSSFLSLLVGVALVGLCVSAGRGLTAYGAASSIVLGDGSLLDPQHVAGDKPFVYRDGCHLEVRQTQYGSCDYGAGSSSNAVVLFGDSHAAQYFPALKEAADKLGWRLLSRTKSACPSIDVLNWHWNRYYEECQRWRENVLAEIREIKPAVVILANSSAFKFLENEKGRLVHAERAVTQVAEGEREIAATILASHATVILLRDSPILPESPIECLLLNPKAEERCAWSRGSVLKPIRYPYASLDTANKRVRVIDFANSLCGTKTCTAVRNGTVVMHDEEHLTASFAKTLAPSFVELLKQSRAGDAARSSP